ncbi:MAG: winged helix-turn-helix transcriptional regulator [Asgard group archaeon]|nr:winged helix-turn-helix transcriptional regulator [Asgard group archaeon]
MRRKWVRIVNLLVLIVAVGFTGWLIWLSTRSLPYYEPYMKKMIYISLAIVVLILLISFFGALSSSLTYENILENYTRARIYVMIKNNPGIHFSDLVKNLHLSNGQAFWHLRWLEHFEMIKRIKSNRFHLFYLNDGSNQETDELIAHTIIMKSDTRKELLELISNEQGITQSQLKKKTNLSQSTISYHLAILENEGLILQRKINRRKYYFQNE